MESEKDKNVILYIFVIMVLNGFYYGVVGNYGALMYFIASLVVGYFVIFPKSFFRALDIAKHKADNIRGGMVSSVPHTDRKAEPIRADTEGERESKG